jgi:hypothetical protein
MRGRPSVRAIVALLVALAGAVSCSGRSSDIGAGNKVDFCVAYLIFDHIQEPRPDSKREVFDYAEGFIRVIDRVDPKRELRVPDDQARLDKKPKVATDALADLGTIRSSMVRLRDAVKAAPGDGEQVRAAGNALAADQEHAAAQRRTTAYFRSTCKPD